MTVWLIGERANGPKALDQRSTDAATRLRHGAFQYGPSRTRLVSLGLVWHRAANLLPRLPTEDATWDSRDRAQAREAATALVIEAASRGAALVLAGARVAWAFGLTYAPCVWQSVDVDDVRVHCLTIPHPSGRSRWWNEIDNLARFRAAIGDTHEA